MDSPAVTSSPTIYYLPQQHLAVCPRRAGYSPPPAGIDPPAGTKLTVHKAHKPRRRSSTHAAQKVAAKAAKLKAVDAALRRAGRHVQEQEELSGLPRQT